MSDKLIEKLQKIIEREIDNVPMVLADPLTLRRLRAERLAQAAATVIQAYGDARADAARREALEEAAEEADEYASWHDGHDDGLSGFGKMAEGARELAAAIRALKENLNAR